MNIKRRLTYVAALAATLQAASVARAGETADASTEATADVDREALVKQLWDWYGKASAFHDAGKLSEAWTLYQRIWNYRKTYDVATSLGGICLERAQYALAAHYYKIALQEMVPTQSPRFVEGVKQAYEKARAQVTEIETSVAVNGRESSIPVTIFEQGADVYLEQPVFLEPGDHVLEARAKGWKPVTLRIQARPGSKVHWAIDFDTPQEESDEAPAPALERPSQRYERVRHPWIVFPVGGVVTAGLALGAVSNIVQGRNAYDSVLALDLSAGECRGGNSTARCQRAEALRERTGDADTRAWLFGGGAAVAAIATGVVYWLWETESPVSASINPASQYSEVTFSYDF